MAGPPSRKVVSGASGASWSSCTRPSLRDTTDSPANRPSCSPACSCSSSPPPASYWRTTTKASAPSSSASTPADNDREAYIHFVGVDPKLRGTGVARRLYGEFFRRAAEAGRREVRAITSPGNAGSIAFHRAMGFTCEGGDRQVDGVPVSSDYDGPGQDRVCFMRPLGR
ncbi:GNAT family N-acetyltransferase [Streptomyces sp. NBC_01235]|uniref:GNAT family N-acetyltransferase n=1 Tax=Streptomyces sp. NBC_01235 TaxID=2903788 RepID=UPI002E0DD59C|nr:GNAT family N-acetyltransferase [Streptomyces sp. NBC_01235]